MARARNIKPGFFLNEELASLPFEARILFQGLWCLADREGRLQDRPLRIKAIVFPYDPVDTDLLLEALQSKGFILRYQVGSAPFIQVANFLKHQQPHYKETASIIPPPQTQVEVEVKTNQKNDVNQTQADYDLTSDQVQPDVESIKVLDDPLIPDSLIPENTPASKKRRGRKLDEHAGAIVRLRKIFDDKLEGKYGPHSFPWEVAAVRFKALLNQKIPENEIIRRIENYFASTEKFIEDNGYSVTIFTDMKFNALAGGPIGRNGNYARHAGSDTPVGYAAPVAGKYAGLTQRADTRP